MANTKGSRNPVEEIVKHMGVHKKHVSMLANVIYLTLAFLFIGFLMGGN